MERSYKYYLRKLDRQYEALAAKVSSGERLLPSDLPRITKVPVIPAEERKIIYEHQEGFEFHGMPSKNLGTILNGKFHGSAVWVPHSCNEAKSLEDFEDSLRLSYSYSSAGYEVLIIKCNPDEDKRNDGGSMDKRVDTIKGRQFTWNSMAIFYGNPSHNSATAKKAADYSLIKPRLAIIDTPFDKNIHFNPENYFKEIINKIWLYIAWTQRAPAVK
jgi:hypothetical protein